MTHLCLLFFTTLNSLVQLSGIRPLHRVKLRWAEVTEVVDKERYFAPTTLSTSSLILTESMREVVIAMTIL